jgi:hypothetical protein
MEMEESPIELQEGVVENVEHLVSVKSGVAPTINATDLEREISLNVSGSQSCAFDGVFSYLKCIIGKVSISARDLIDLPSIESLSAQSDTGNSEKIKVGRYNIEMLHSELIPTTSVEKNQAVYKGEFYFQAKLPKANYKMFKVSGYKILQSSNTNPQGNDLPFKLVVFNQKLYFAALNDQGFSKLFVSDGQVITQLTNIFPSGNDYFSPAIVFNGELYLEGVNKKGQLKLFKIDKNKKIAQVSDTNPNGSDNTSDYKVFNGELYFRSNNMKGFSKLFKLGDDGMRQVSNLNPENHDAPEFLEVYNGELYFSVYKEKESGYKLYKTDGRQLIQVVSINPGLNDEPSDLKVYQNKLYFVALNKEGRRKLFRTEGQGIEQFSDLQAGLSDFAQNFREKKAFMTVYNDELFFVAKNKDNAFKIFKTDGKSISQVSNINEKNPSLNPTGSDFPFNLFVYNDQLYFSAYSNQSGLKLFKLKSEISNSTSK